MKYHFPRSESSCCINVINNSNQPRLKILGMDKNTRHAHARSRTHLNAKICKFEDIKVTFSLHAVCDLHLLAGAEALRRSGAFGLRVMAVGEAVAVLHRAGIHNRRVRDGTGLLVRRICHFLLLKLGLYSFKSGVLRR